MCTLFFFTDFQWRIRRNQNWFLLILQTAKPSTKKEYFLFSLVAELQIYQTLQSSYWLENFEGSIFVWLFVRLVFVTLLTFWCNCGVISYHLKEIYGSHHRFMFFQEKPLKYANRRTMNLVFGVCFFAFGVIFFLHFWTF